MSDCLLAAFRRIGIPKLESSLRVVYLREGATLSTAGTQPRFCHFLRSGAASASIRLTSGSSASVRLSGSGDLLEIYQLLGVALPESRIFMLVPGEAVRAPFPLVRQAFLQDEEFRRLTLAAVGAQSLETEQTSVCGHVHQLEQRLARYLLTIFDRCGDATIPITQEALSLELGVRRSSIALASGSLRSKGLLAFRRRRIQVLDRSGLERAACECYLAIRKLREAVPLATAVPLDWQTAL